MKRRSTTIVMILSVLVILAILVFLGGRYNDQPILNQALQGKELIGAIERGFDIPIDPMAERPGVFLGNLLYWRRLKWNAGAEITICGVTDPTVQKRIIDFVESEVHKNALCDIELVFEDMASIKKQDSSTTRISGPELKRIRIRGVSRSWRELQAEQEAQQDAPSKGG